MDRCPCRKLSNFGSCADISDQAPRLIYALMGLTDSIESEGPEA